MKDIQLTISIDTDWHAAFGEDEDSCREELARILHEAADRVENLGEDFKLYDVNGNRVGTCSLTLNVPETDDKDEE